MKQTQFEAAHAELWSEIGAILGPDQPNAHALPGLYRRLCQCLALADQRAYSPALTDHLQKMVADCHRRLYGAVAARPNNVVTMLRFDFPRRVRAEWRLLLFASLAFWGVGLATGLLVWLEPHWAYSFMSSRELDDVRRMYAAADFNDGRGGEGDVLMFGHYIWNNVSIGFRTFAGGIFGALPALLSLGFNGMHIGVVGAWLGKDPQTSQNFWSFVITHASFEVTGLVLSGMAGIRLGLTVIKPGRRSRGHALALASKDMFPVIAGAAMLTVLAAFVEAFWSASAVVPPGVKFGVGGLCWLAVIAFFAFAGRARN
ncbi:stage II sporulation protein M [Massilia glaciei]|uniref:Stage II sporulation protein M n=1 Tax=Massilia glaciei TaxID=1524097 RepID=A0A2U2HGR3_9BURK|nr:stage II sporulation protein M [Massilia glaciei]PWF44381.1 stage II sporulation protein M [Massilia glaciei]